MYRKKKNCNWLQCNQLQQWRRVDRSLECHWFSKLSKLISWLILLILTDWVLHVWQAGFCFTCSKLRGGSKGSSYQSIWLCIRDQSNWHSACCCCCCGRVGDKHILYLCRHISYLCETLTVAFSGIAVFTLALLWQYQLLNLFTPVSVTKNKTKQNHVKLYFSFLIVSRLGICFNVK